jgi:hypothetical protein
MQSIYSNDRLYELFSRLLDEPDERDRLYVYRVVEGKTQKPALLKTVPFSGLESHLRDEHGGGEFQIMIRRGEKMLLAGAVAIASPRTCGDTVRGYGT